MYSNRYGSGMTRSASTLVRLSADLYHQGAWQPSRELTKLAGKAYVRTWGEVLSALRAAGLAVGHTLPDRTVRAYRVVVRREGPAQHLVGLAEWHRSTETDRWAPVLVWTVSDHSAKTLR